MSPSSEVSERITLDVCCRGIVEEMPDDVIMEKELTVLGLWG
jgi:hypothetical protein